MSHIFDNLLGRWALNDAAGNGIWKDTSPNSLNMVGVGVPSPTTGHNSLQPSAVAFNGTDQSLQVDPASLSGFSVNSNFTLSAWFRVNSLIGAQGLVDFWNNANQRSFLLRIETDQKLKFWHSTSGSNVHSITATIPVNSVAIWHHAMVIQDAANVSLFLNNALVGSGTVVGPTFQPTSTFLRFGVFDNSNQHLNGAMNDIIIWNKALSMAQRNEIFSLGEDFMTQQAPTGIFPGRHELILGSDKQVIHTVKRNDLQPHFYFKLMDSDFNNIDITSFALCVNMAHITSGTTVISVFPGITFTDTVNGDDASVGNGHYTWGSSDTQIPGTFAFEIEGTPATGGKITFPNPGRALIIVNSDVVNE